MKIALAAGLAMVCATASAAKQRYTLYRNERWGFCAYFPASWNGPAVASDHTGGRFVAPFADVAITAAAAANESRSTILNDAAAGSQPASLNDYRDAIVETWRRDHSVSDVIEESSESTTLEGIPALRIVLSYRKGREKRRFETVFALRNNTQYALEYDASRKAAKQDEKYFEGSTQRFEFECAAGAKGEAK